MLRGSAKRSRRGRARGSRIEGFAAVDLGAAAVGAGEVDEAGARRAGLDRDEGAGEGPQPALRDGQWALGMDVQHYLTDEPVLACPPSAWYRLRKLARRYNGLLTAAAVVFVSLIAGTAVATWQAVRATVAEQRALAGFRMARDAVDRSFTQVSQNPLLKAEPGEVPQRPTPERREFYERFVRERFDAPEVRYDLGLAQHQLAAIDRELGNYPAALESAARAVTLLGALGGLAPERARVPTRPGGRSRHARPGLLGFRAGTRQNQPTRGPSRSRRSRPPRTRARRNTGTRWRKP